jgi:hypothetical protein
MMCSMLALLTVVALQGAIAFVSEGPCKFALTLC